MSAVAHSLRLARIDATRMVRKHTDWREGIGSAVSLVLFFLMVGGLTVGGGYGGFRLGQAVVAGTAGLDGIGVVRAARGLLGVFALVASVVYAVRAVGGRGTLANADGVLTLVPTREAVAGLLLSEYAYFLLWLLPPTLGAGVGLALGTGVVWPALSVPAAVALVGVAVVAVGYPVGLAVRHVVTRFPAVARHKVSLLVLVFVAYFVAIVTGSVNRLVVDAFEPMMRSPVGWYGDLLLLGWPGVTPSSTNAAGAFGVTALVAATGVLAAVRLATVHWFSDPALAGEEPPEETEVQGRGVERYLLGVLDRPTAALVALAWRRAARSPFKLLYAAYPLLFLAGVGAEIVQTGRVPAYLPYGLLVFVAWAAGVIFTLNPLGDQGSVLATTLLSEVTGKRFVRAHVVAGLVVAVPVATVLTAVAGVLSPLETGTVAPLVAATPVVMVVASGLSVGIGMAFPRFEATTVTRSMKTVLPSRWGFVLFSLHLFLTAVAAVLVFEPFARELGAGILSFVLPFGLSVAAGTLYWVALVALVPLLAAPVASYRYAVRAFDTYTPA